MTAEIDKAMGFAPDYDSPIPYMLRTREYYRAIGYDPYRWAHYLEVPFSPLRKPLAESRVALITTAAPFDPEKGDQGPGAAYNSAAKFYQVHSGRTDEEHDLRISHIAYDRKHSPATDMRAWFPLQALRDAAGAGRIGGLTEHFFGAPTNRSHRHTVEIDCPEILSRCLQDGADVAVLVPNCPVCHQTVSLTARYLEQHGIPTVVLGCAKDIVEHCGVPRFLFSDFPLGNAAGKPHDAASQAATIEMALKLLESAVGPRTTLQSPQRWDATGEWKLDYLNLEQIGAEELARRKEEFLRQKAIAKDLREKAA
ncbi:glycine reductase [Belnapia moabensis]|uniref:glycine reductase n=1 Tax=Belnapia moabensis TaxID=365533 RepID=UPI0005BA7316|nr:glycine reductase [Belnapia moabensis]